MVLMAAKRWVLDYRPTVSYWQTRIHHVGRHTQQKDRLHETEMYEYDTMT